MDGFIENEIRECFNNNGMHGALKYIFQSRKVPFIEASVDISKTLELTSLPKGERSLVKYLNYLEDIKRSKKCLYPSLRANEVVLKDNEYVNKSKKERKMSQRLIKEKKAQVKRLSASKLAYYKSFIGVVELDRDGVQSKAVAKKLEKIKSLYTAKIPRCLIDIDPILNALTEAKVKVSKQDLISFYSIISVNFYRSTYVNIPASVWNSFFGIGKVKIAKKIFEELNLIILMKSAIPGFKAAQYKCVFENKNINLDDMLEIKISSIKTLEKINRIKKYKGKFLFKDRLKALKVLSQLYSDSKIKKGRINLTSIFLISGEFQPLIDDLKFMNSYLYINEMHKEVLEIGAHITRYINYNDSNHYKRYSPLFISDNSSNNQNTA